MEAVRSIFYNLAALAAAAGGAVLIALCLGLSAARALKLLLAALALALLLHLVVFLDATLAYVVFPYEGKSVVEGVTLYNSLQYLHGEQPYHSPDELPFRSLVYPPAHEMLLAGFLWVVGPSLYSSLYAGRLFSELCVLGAALGVGFAVRRHARSWAASFFGGALVLCCYGVTGHWLEQVRSDALLLFLLAWGTYLTDRAVSRDRMPVAGLIFFLLAVFTKQVAVFAPAAAVIVLWSGSRRKAVLWGISFAACAAAIFAAMEVWSRGWFSFYTLRVPLGAGFKLSQLDLASIFFGSTWILLWGALLVALPGETRTSLLPSDRRRGLALWAWMLVGALALSLLQSLKWGAALNTFVPLIPALAVLSGIALDALMRRFREPGWGQIAVVGAALMQVAMLSYQPILPTEADRQAQERIAAEVRNAPGDVFVSVFSSQVYLHGKKYFGDDVTIGDLVRANQWQGGERNQLLRKIRAGGFSVLILRPRLEPPDFAAAVQQSYVAVPERRIWMRTDLTRWPYMEVYVPRRPAGAP